MSEGNTPVPEQANAVEPPYQAAALVVPPRPNEFGFPLREDEFHILCEGEVSDARAGRDLCAGFFVGAVIGFVGVLATTDWGNVWQPERRMPFLAWSAVLLIIVAGSGVGWIICYVRLRRTRKDSPYSRLRKRISDWFNSQSA